MTALSPLRTGRVTGSRVGAILGHDRGKAADDVMREMVRGHFGDPEEFVGNWMTEYGNEQEEPARAAYERWSGDLVLDAQQFIVHPEIDWLGVSPDGTVGTTGAVEIKCPTTLAKWLLLADKPQFEDQIQLLLACTGREWCHFVRHVPGQPIAPERVPYDPAWLPTHLPVLQAFHDRYEQIIADPELAAPYRTDLVALLDDPDSLLDELELVQILDAQADLAEREKQARKRMTDRAEAVGSKTLRGRFLQVTRTSGTRSVRYKDALAKCAPGADLTEFTDTKAPSYRITRIKEAQ